MNCDRNAFRYESGAKRPCDTMLDTGKLFHRIRDFVTWESTPLKAIFCSHRSLQYCQLRKQTSSSDTLRAQKLTVQMKRVLIGTARLVSNLRPSTEGSQFDPRFARQLTGPSHRPDTARGLSRKFVIPTAELKFRGSNTTQSYWVSGICPSSGILDIRKQKLFGNWMFPSSGEGRETPTLLGPLERANLSHFRWGEADTYSVGSARKG
jgi:hypothetical protein